MVFNFIADAENMPYWMTRLRTIEKIDGPGIAKYHFQLEDAGTFEWIAFDRMEHLEWRASQSTWIEPTASFAMEEVGAKTELRARFEPAVTWWNPIARARVLRRNRSRRERDLDELKNLVEILVNTPRGIGQDRDQSKTGRLSSSQETALSPPRNPRCGP